MLSLCDIERLFARHGASQYSGEAVTHLEHGLQTAQRAEDAGADHALVTACLLHDIGHFLSLQGNHVDQVSDDAPSLRGGHDTPSLRGVDDTHQFIALPFLRGLFPDAVLNPIALHVDAKRYLCQADPGYYARLSEDSKRSLVLQGGVFSAARADAFIDRSGARDAIRLRQWDDLAKVAGLATPPLAHFLARAQRCVLTPARVPSHGTPVPPFAQLS